MQLSATFATADRAVPEGDEIQQVARLRSLLGLHAEGEFWIGGPVPRNTVVPELAELLRRGMRLLWLRETDHASDPASNNRQTLLDLWDVRTRLIESIIVKEDWLSSSTKSLCTVVMDVDPDHEDEFNDWYSEEHAEYIRKVPGIYSASRFRFVEGYPRYLAVYNANSTEAFMNHAYAEATETPWTFRVRRFMRNISRNIYERYDDQRLA